MRKLFQEMYAELSPFGKFWFTLGLVALAAACLMSFFFGKSISLTHGIFLVVLSVVAAFGPHAAHKVWEMGSRKLAAVLGIICVPLLAIEFYSHAGYTAGLRGMNIGTAKVQNVKYTGSQKAVSEDEEALGAARKSLEQLKLANPWVTTVSADSLRAQIPAIDEKLRQEERRGGCGPKCLAIKQQKAEVEGKIALAEERNGTAIRIADLEKRLAGRRDKADQTEFKQSAVDLQNKFLAKAVALIGNGDLEPSEFMTEGAEQSVNLAMAVAGTGLPALCFFVAGCLVIGGLRKDFTPGRTEASEPAPTHPRPIVALRRRKWRELYDAQCNTMGIAPVTA